jgi:hypothetical protein
MSFELWSTVICAPVAVVVAATRRLWKKRGADAGTSRASIVLAQILAAQASILAGLFLLSLPGLFAVSGDVGRVSVAGVVAYFTPLVAPLGGIAAWAVAERARSSDRPMVALLGAYVGALAGLGLCLGLYQTVGVVNKKAVSSSHSMHEDIGVRMERERENRELRIRGAMAWPFLWVIAGTCGGVVGYWLAQARFRRPGG